MKPWNAEHAAGRITRPLRHNGTPYRGMNILLLWGEAMAKGYAAGIWMTYKQAQELARCPQGRTRLPGGLRQHHQQDGNERAGRGIEREIPFMMLGAARNDTISGGAGRSQRSRFLVHIGRDEIKLSHHFLNLSDGTLSDFLKGSTDPGEAILPRRCCSCQQSFQPSKYRPDQTFCSRRIASAAAAPTTTGRRSNRPVVRAGGPRQPEKMARLASRLSEEPTGRLMSAAERNRQRQRQRDGKRRLHSCKEQPSFGSKAFARRGLARRRCRRS